MIPKTIRVNNDICIALATTFSLLVTFSLYSLSTGNRASNSLFQHVVADTVHHTCLFCRCLLNERSHTICISLTSDLGQNMCMTVISVLVMLALKWYYGHQIIPGLLSCALTIFSVWFLARWCDRWNLWYPVDTLTVHLLVWQFSYLTFHWCFHQLSWPLLFLYQVSVCTLTAVFTFALYDLCFRYFPPMTLVMVWLVALDDIFACLSVNGRLQAHIDDGSLLSLIPTYGKLPVFCFYTHDIEDGPEAAHGWEGLAHGDFMIYDLMLLWLLPSLSSTEVQLCILFGFIGSVQTATVVARKMRFLRMGNLMPAVPVPVIFVSAYALILDFLYPCFGENGDLNKKN